MIDTLWLVGAFVAGSIVTIRCKTMYHREIFDRNAELETENARLKHLVDDLSEKIETHAKQITVGVLERVIGNLKEK